MTCKKLITASVALSVAFSSAVYAGNDGEKDLNVYINSMEQEEFLNSPYEKNSIIYLPLRELCEKLGYKVDYSYPYAVLDRGADMAIVKLSEDTIYYENSGLEKNLRNKAEILNGVMYVPLDLADNLFPLGLSADGETILITRYEENNKSKAMNDYEFAISLLKGLPENENGVIAPNSLKTALAIIANGSEGETQEQLLNVLKIHDLDGFNSIIRNNAELRENSPFKSVSYTSVNSVWVNKDNYDENENPLQNEFTDIVENYYKSMVGTVKNGDVSHIDKWIEEKTNGLVKSPIKNSEFNVVVLNAASFEGTWLHPFDSEGKEGIFYNADGSESNINFMSVKGSFAYYEEDGVKAATLAYGSNPAYNRESGNKLEEFYTPYDMTFVLSEKSVDSSMLERIFNGSETESVYIQMPRFEISGSIDITEMLRNMGVSFIFESGSADFSPMFGEKSKHCISQIIQNTFISVYEKGTRAAAVSAVMVAGGSSETKSFIADRPFYYFLRDKETGEILFEGKFAKAE